jgi:hypothetical protein
MTESHQDRVVLALDHALASAGKGVR